MFIHDKTELEILVTRSYPLDIKKGKKIKVITETQNYKIKRKDLVEYCFHFDSFATEFIDYVDDLWDDEVSKFPMEFCGERRIELEAIN
jgi:hypothetical protein